MRTTYIIMLFSMTLFSCSKPLKVMLPELSRAESLVFAYPDSALAILDSMPPPSPSDKFQYATWCLLHTQAQDKSYIKQTSDSLINIAYSYFMKSKDSKRKATTLYYKGRVADDMHNAEEATIYYLEAKEIAKEIKDYKLAQLICSNLGMVYAYRQLTNLAHIEVTDAYNYAVLAKDSSIISYTLSYFARIAGQQLKWDSCAYYYNQAIQIAEQSNSIRALNLALGEISYAYIELKKYDLAIEYLKKSENVKIKGNYKGIYQDYLIRGCVYMEMEKFDSAVYYLNQSLKTDNIYTIRGAYEFLYLVNEKQKKFKEAIKYNNLRKQFSDSINIISKTKEIVELQAKHKQDILLNKKNHLKLEKHNISRNILLIIVAMTCIIATIIIIYQRRLIKREQSIRIANDKIHYFILQLNQNKEITQRNNKQIKSMSTQLEENNNLKEYINEQKKELSQIYEYNDYLQTQNTYLLDKINHHAQILREKERSIHSYKELKEENITLKEKEKLLSEYISEQLELFKQLKEVPKYIKDEQWPAILKTTNIIYHNFTVRLHKEFPALTDNDLQICSLLKLRFTPSIIATLTGVSPSSVTKRKQRIKERMSQQYAELWNKETSLEIYIWNY